MPERSGLIHSS
jgi:AraC-like DNA-binding protein